MASHFRTLATAALLTTSISLTAAQSGSGTTTRYWDCCKPSCAWPGKGDSGVVGTCDVNDQPLSDSNAKSGCEGGGTAYMCSSQAPWAVSDDLAYGFTAVSGNNPKCCQCWQLTFTSGPISGKKMIVQATNTGGDVGNTQFDLAVRLAYISDQIRSREEADRINRCQEAASAFSTVAQHNGAPPPMFGVNSMVARKKTHALNSQRN